LFYNAVYHGIFPLPVVRFDAASVSGDANITKMAGKLAQKNGGKTRAVTCCLVSVVYHGIIPLPVERSSVSGDANITESWIRLQ
jgi:hypothetical protein